MPLRFPAHAGSFHAYHHTRRLDNGCGIPSGATALRLSPPPSEVHSPSCRIPWSHSSRLPVLRPLTGTPLPQRFLDWLYITAHPSICQQVFAGNFQKNSRGGGGDKKGASRRKGPKRRCRKAAISFYVRARRTPSPARLRPARSSRLYTTKCRLPSEQRRAAGRRK